MDDLDTVFEQCPICLGDGKGSDDDEPSCIYCEVASGVEPLTQLVGAGREHECVDQALVQHEFRGPGNSRTDAGPDLQEGLIECPVSGHFDLVPVTAAYYDERYAADCQEAEVSEGLYELAIEFKA